MFLVYPPLLTIILLFFFDIFLDFCLFIFHFFYQNMRGKSRQVVIGVLQNFRNLAEKLNIKECSIMDWHTFARIHNILVQIYKLCYACTVLGHRQRVDVVRSITEAPSQKDLEVLRCGSILRQRITQMLLHFEGVRLTFVHTLQQIFLFKVRSQRNLSISLY